MEFIKKNIAILLATMLPVLLILVVALSVYLPSVFLKTNYNFIYTVCDYSFNGYDSFNGCGTYISKHYSVVDGKLTLNPVTAKRYDEKNRVYEEIVIDDVNKEHIFLYDTDKKESREISIDEAKALKLNSLMTSPDGVTVTDGYNNSGDFIFPFGGRSSYGYYLSKGNSRAKINLIGNKNQYYYSNNFRFIGWVLPN